MRTKSPALILLFYALSICYTILHAQNCDTIPAVYPTQYYNICEDECMALISDVPSDFPIFWTGPEDFNHLFICAANLGLGPHEFIATSDYNGCISTQLFVVIVHPYIHIDVDSFPPICEMAEPIRLPSSQNDVRGRWSGLGVVNNTFTPLGLIGKVDLIFTPDTIYCATIDTAFINVKPNQSSTTYLTNITCDESQVGIVTESYTHSSRCLDSLVFTEYILSPSDTTYLTRTTCDSTQTGLIEEYHTNSVGCDSLVIFNTMLLPTAHTIFNQSICEGETFEINGQAYHQTGTYSTIFPAANGCDSIFTLNLLVENDNATTVVQQICEGETLTFGGNTYHESGFYTHHFQSIHGCDSIVHLDLSVNNTVQTQLVETFCEGHQILIGSEIFEESGHYTRVLQSQTGCDSIVDLDLMVFPTKYTTLHKSICAGESFEVNGQIYNQSGTYTTTLSTIQGCDSVITINLRVENMFHTQLIEQICEGESIQVGNTIYQETGIYTQTLLTNNGCDSMVTLDLWVDEIVHTQLREQICEGDHILIGSEIFEETGHYSVILQSQMGCDSIVDLDLTVFPIESITLHKNICSGESFEINGQVYDQTGTYANTFSSINGCDSTVILNLYLFDDVQTHLIEQICEGEVIMIGSLAYTASGYYTQNLTTNNGCDSLVTLDLTVFPTSPTTIYEQLCAGNCLTYKDSTFCDAGIYTFILKNHLGCDSIITLNLDVTEEISMDWTSTAACFNSNNGKIDIKNVFGGTSPYLYSIDGEHFQTESIFTNLESGTYPVYVEDSEGCIIALDIKIPSIPAISVSDDTIAYICGTESILLNATPLNDSDMTVSYLWQDDSTENTYFASSPYQYWVEINNTCHTIRKEFTVIDEYIPMKKQIYVPNAFSPNGDHENDVFKPYTNLNLNDYEFYVADRWGNLIFESKDNKEAWDGAYQEKIMNGAVMIWWMKASAMSCLGKEEEVLMKGYVTVVR